MERILHPVSLEARYQRERHINHMLRLGLLLAILCFTGAAFAQEVVDRFNRANSNTVGGGWTETETAGAGASINGNQLRLARTGTGNNRQFVTQTTPGSYLTTLNQNNCTLTWAFSFRQSESDGELSGFDGGDDGMAVVLAGSNANLTLGQGYAVVLGESGNTDRVRLVRYNNGLDADANLNTIIQAGNFDNDYLDVRVTYVPSTDTWSLFYRDNGNTRFGDPLTAATSAGSAVDATYTGTGLPIIGCLWNHDGDTGENAVFDNIHVPGGLPTLPSITPPSASICDGANVDLTASASSTTTARVTFSSTGGPSAVSVSGANDGSVYPWNVSVSGLPTSGVTVESVTLNGVTHTYPDDLDILLQSATGTNVILMSDVGGGTDITSENFVFMDGESAMADNAVNRSGIYAPTNSGTPDSWPTTPGPGSFTQSSPSLSLFTGDFNGTWGLLIRDDANADGGSVASWSITFTYTSTVTYTWSPAAGLSGTTGATVTASPAGTSTYTVTAAHSGNGCTRSADVTVTVGGCTYYSRATGDVSDAIWSTTPSGLPAPGAVTFTAANNMVVQNGHSVTNDGATPVADLTVETGGTMVLDAGSTLTLNGTSATIDGTLTANDNSTFAIAGSGAKTLSLASTTSFWDLTADAPDGTTVTGTIHMRGTLLLDDGNFDCTGNPVVMRSTSAYTGRLGPVGATASYTGNMRMERFIPSGATNWRLIGSPIQNRRVSHLQDDFFTAGYPGSQYPNFFDPVGSGIYWPSIRWYDETNTGASVNNGLQGVSSQTQDLLIGQGFAAWCGTGLTTTTAFTIDLENNAPVIAATPITLPMAYTNTGNPSVDGWNLVANPLPSPIAFDQIARGADVEDYVTYFDPATGNMATWDIGLNAGTNGGTNTIQSMQGFYLKAIGSGVTTTVSESAKVAGNNGGFFGGSEQAPDLLRLHIASGLNTFSDETVVVFNAGEPSFTSNDVPKFNFGHPQAPRIGTTADAVNLAINAYGAFSSAIQIPVLVHIPVTGTYTLTATGIEQVGLTCIRLEDLVAGTFTTLEEGSTYSFSAEAGANAEEPRFLIHASAPVPVAATDALCHSQANGGAEIVLAEGAADVTIYNDMGQAVGSSIAANGTVAFDNLPAGDYEITVEGYLGCTNLLSSFSIAQPAAMEAEAEVADASCPNIEDGFISLSIVGGTAPYEVNWNDGATGIERPATAGVFIATGTDANGCVVNAEVTVGSGNAPVAQASAVSLTVAVGQPVTFINSTSDAVEQTWDFGDGNTSDEEAPSHTYDAPGSYTVVLTASNGYCSSTSTVTITVELSTSVTEVKPATNMRSWLAGDHLVIEHGFSEVLPLTLELINEAGQVWKQQRVAGQVGRMTVPANDLASGIWYVRVSTAEDSRTVPVVIVR
ncbi:MAG: PKD domain-containing protein [Flavobacteriales bacterium]|nr:PKD domain-containing protein [Flavobacteriales bacterium]